MQKMVPAAALLFETERHFLTNTYWTTVSSCKRDSRLRKCNFICALLAGMLHRLNFRWRAPLPYLHVLPHALHIPAADHTDTPQLVTQAAKLLGQLITQPSRLAGSNSRCQRKLLVG
jgi:hypothetical protein